MSNGTTSFFGHVCVPLSCSYRHRRRELQNLSRDETQLLVIIEHGVHVLDPECVDGAIEDDPLLRLARVVDEAVVRQRAIGKDKATIVASDLDRHEVMRARHGGDGRDLAAHLSRERRGIERQVVRRRDRRCEHVELEPDARVRREDDARHVAGRQHELERRDAARVHEAARADQRQIAVHAKPAGAHVRAARHDDLRLRAECCGHRLAADRVVLRQRRVDLATESRERVQLGDHGRLQVVGRHVELRPRRLQLTEGEG